MSIEDYRKLTGKRRSIVEMIGMPSALFLSAITIMEIEQGIVLIDRRDDARGALLRHWLEHGLLPAFSGHVLPVDTAVARRCATLHVPTPRAERDALIAATAMVHGMTIVTRNLIDFKFQGLVVLNPWDPAPAPHG